MTSFHFFFGAMNVYYVRSRSLLFFSIFFLCFQCWQLIGFQGFKYLSMGERRKWNSIILSIVLRILGVKRVGFFVVVFSELLFQKGVIFRISNVSSASFIWYVLENRTLVFFRMGNGYKFNALDNRLVTINKVGINGILYNYFYNVYVLNSRWLR